MRQSAHFVTTIKELFKQVTFLYKSKHKNNCSNIATWRAAEKNSKSISVGGIRTLCQRAVVMLRGGGWKRWEGRGKREGEEEKQVPQSYRAGASKDSKGGREGRRRKTLVKLSTDA